MRGIANPGKKVAVQVVLTGNGDYEYLCETVRQIKRKTHETGEGQLKMTSPRERMYIVVIAPICMASEGSRKKIEKAITGKETKTGPEPKKIRETTKDLHAAGFDLGPDYANTMVTWVGPGTSQDGQDPYTSARLMNENLEKTFRQALSVLGVLPLSWSVTRTLIPQMGNWYEKGIFVTPGRSAGQHHFMALVATLSMILPMDIPGVLHEASCWTRRGSGDHHHAQGFVTCRPLRGVVGCTGGRRSASRQRGRARSAPGLWQLWRVSRSAPSASSCSRSHKVLEW